MKILFTIILVASFVHIGFAQKYDFVPEELTRKAVNELGGQARITSEVKIYLPSGESIPIDELQSYFQDKSREPVFFVDKQNTVKVLVFEEASEARKAMAAKMKAGNEDLASGNSMTEFEVTDLDGNKVSLSDFKGKVVALNFWFIACKPCIMEMPHLNKIVSKYKDEDVVFLAVTFNNDQEVRKFLKKKDFDYTHAANEMAVIRDMTIQSFPTNIILDQEGKIVLSHKGYSPDLMSEINDTIKGLLNKN